MVEPSVDKVCLDNVYKCVGIYFHHLFHKKLRFLTGNYRVDHGGGILGVAAHTVQPCGGVVGEMGDLFVNLVRMPCHDKERMLLVTLVQDLDHLCGGELEDDGVQSFVPAEEQSGDNKKDSVSAENIIPDIAAVLFGKINGDEIGSSGTGISDQAQRNDHAVDQPAEDTDQQGIIGDGLRRDQVGEDTRQQNNYTGAHGKFQTDEFQTDKNRDRVQGEVDHRIGNLYPGEFPENALDQKGDSVKASGDQPSGIDKGVDVYRADDGGYNSAAIAFHFDLWIHVFQSCHIIHFLMFLSFSYVIWLPIGRTRRRGVQVRCLSPAVRSPGSPRFRKTSSVPWQAYR